MKKNKSASLEARLTNSKDLIAYLKDFSLYSPSSEDLKIENYADYVNSVDSQITPFKNSEEVLNSAEKVNNEVFEKIELISRFVGSEIAELKGKDSVQFRQVNSVLKKITGVNITEFARKKREIIGKLKEGEPVPEFTSVSELNKRSVLGNFRSLIAVIRTFDFYKPADPAISLSALESLEAEALNSLSEVAGKESEYINQRSRMIHYFEDKGGLKDRASRAKLHVKRKYGIKSPEYRSLIYRKF